MCESSQFFKASCDEKCLQHAQAGVFYTLKSFSTFEYWVPTQMREYTDNIIQVLVQSILYCFMWDSIKGLCKI